MAGKQKGVIQLEGITGNVSGSYNAIEITKSGIIRLSKRAKDLRSQKTINKKSEKLNNKK